MNYKEIIPGERLRQYVKCYYTYQSQTDTAFDDIVFPSGCIEIVFNLGTGKWQTATNSGFITHPPVELWGQIIQPLPVKSIGQNTMLGIRFFPHSAVYFLNDKIELFNNTVVDFTYMAGNAVSMLYSKLQDVEAWDKRIELE